jgi:hypothetical protein
MERIALGFVVRRREEGFQGDAGSCGELEYMYEALHGGYDRIIITDAGSEPISLALMGRSVITWWRELRELPSYSHSCEEGLHGSICLQYEPSQYLKTLYHCWLLWLLHHNNHDFSLMRAISILIQTSRIYKGMSIMYAGPCRYAHNRPSFLIQYASKCPSTLPVAHAMLLPIMPHSLPNAPE